MDSQWLLRGGEKDPVKEFEPVNLFKKWSESLLKKCAYDDEIRVQYEEEYGKEFKDALKAYRVIMKLDWVNPDLSRDYRFGTPLTKEKAG